jgi:benzoate/toluate 1,2-dioxygenase beta subunit
MFHEAWLLDSGRFDDWLDLFADDGIYRVPSEPQQTVPIETANIIYEDLSLMRMRVQRGDHPQVHALEPGPRTLHTVDNVEAAPTADGGIAVRST